MKTLVTSLVIAATVALSSASFAQNKNTFSVSKEMKDVQFQVNSIMQGKIDVTVLKNKGESLSVKLTDTNGNTLAVKSLDKNDPTSRVRFNMNELPNGIYHVVVTEGAFKETKEVILDTHNVDSYRTITMG
jgi:hypothetical protein